MGIYIKGMEMPSKKNGAVIILYPNGTAVFEDGKEYQVVEVKPHGRLIDADALMKDGWLNLHKEVMRMGGYAIHELPLTNPSIPVVIEKENC